MTQRGRLDKVERKIAENEVGHVLIASRKHEELGLDQIDQRLFQLTDKLHRVGRLTTAEQREYRELLAKLAAAHGPHVVAIPPRGVRLTVAGVERDEAGYAELVQVAKSFGWRGGERGKA
jgi:hypothetical protein